MSARDRTPDRIFEAEGDEMENSTEEVDASSANQHSDRNMNKRVKQGDDSFEHEHRNASAQQQRANIVTTSLPHFRQQSGAVGVLDKKKSFLICANSAEPSDRLMVRETRPLSTSNAYSSRERSLSRRYESISQRTRSWQRSSKNKRLLFDGANTSFPVELYVPPTKIRRCYNCQQYNDNRYRRWARPTHGEGHWNIDGTIKIKLQCRQLALKHPGMSARSRLSARLRRGRAVSVSDRTVWSVRQDMQICWGEQTTKVTDGI